MLEKDIQALYLAGTRYDRNLIGQAFRFKTANPVIYNMNGDTRITSKSSYSKTGTNSEVGYANGIFNVLDITHAWFEINGNSDHSYHEYIKFLAQDNYNNHGLITDKANIELLDSNTKLVSYIGRSANIRSGAPTYTDLNGTVASGYHASDWAKSISAIAKDADGQDYFAFCNNFGGRFMQLWCKIADISSLVQPLGGGS